MTLLALLDTCKAYRDMGDAVGQQVIAVADDPCVETVWEQNPTALRMADERFLSVAERLARNDADDELLEDIAHFRAVVAKAHVTDGDDR